jgi:cytochrome c553
MLDVLLKKSLLAGLLLACLPALAAPPTGRQQAQQCATCHGLQGLAIMANTPHLAGQPDVYLIEQLKAFRQWPAAACNHEFD